MPLDPDTARLLELLASLGGGEVSGRPVAEARARLRAFTVDLADPAHLVEVGGTEELTLPGAAGPLPARLYRPPAGDQASGGSRPTVLFFHGGGFVLGDLDTHDNQCRMLCRRTGAVVCSVGYRLAPEDPFPAALDDCLAATRWAAERCATPGGGLGGDPARLAVAGDSAGGNIAAVVAQRCRDDDGPALAAQLLIYPATDLTDAPDDYPSRAANAEGYFLTAADMRWFAEQYVPAGADRTDPALSPLRGRPDGLPPAVVATAEYDPLRDEGLAYAELLAAAGVPVVCHDGPGMIHGFFGMFGLSAAAATAVDAICADFARLLRPA